MIDWLLEVGRPKPDTMLQFLNESAFYAALMIGSSSVVRLFIEHSANLYDEIWFDDRLCLKEIWQIADYFKRLDVIGYLFRSEKGIPLLGQYPSSFSVQTADLPNFAPQWMGELGAPADVLARPEYKEHPKAVIDSMLATCALIKSTDGRPPAQKWDCNLGREANIAAVFIKKLDDLLKNFNDGHRCFGWRSHKSPADVLSDGLTPAQGFHAFAELVSDIGGDPETFRPFSGEHMTPEGEAAMNAVIDLQRELLLRAVADNRAGFKRGEWLGCLNCVLSALFRRRG